MWGLLTLSVSGYLALASVRICATVFQTRGEATFRSVHSASKSNKTPVRTYLTPLSRCNVPWTLGINTKNHNSNAPQPKTSGSESSPPSLRQGSSGALILSHRKVEVRTGGGIPYVHTHHTLPCPPKKHSLAEDSRPKSAKSDTIRAMATQSTR